MSDRVILEPIETFEDDRGISFSIPEQVLHDYPSSHAVQNRPQAVRGNHLHPNGEETLFVQGPAVVRWKAGPSEKGERTVAEGSVVRCHFPAGVSHAVRNTGTGPRLLISFQRSVDGSQITTVRDEILR